MERRLGYVDLLRGWAIFLMLPVHTVRGVLGHWYRQCAEHPGCPAAEAAAGRIRDFLFTTEPYISALFLTLAGFSLVLVARRGSLTTGGRGGGGVLRLVSGRLPRAARLAAISFVIFWIHGGIQWPYPFLSGDILYTFAIGIVAAAPLAVASRWRWPAVAAAVALMCAVTWTAEGHPDTPLARLAQGPGAHLPNLLFLPLGVMLAEAYLHPRAWLRTAVPAAGALILAFYHLAWVPHVREESGEGAGRQSSLEVILDAERGRIVTKREFVTDGGPNGSVYDLRLLGAAAGLLDAPPEPQVWVRRFWNKKLVLVPYLCGLMAVTFGCAWWPGWRRWGPAGCVLLAPLRLIGRHALFLYVFHLALVGAAVVVWGRNTLSAGGAAAVLAGILALCLAAAWCVERVRRVSVE